METVFITNGEEILESKKNALNYFNFELFAILTVFCASNFFIAFKIYVHFVFRFSMQFLSWSIKFFKQAVLSHSIRQQIHFNSVVFILQISL